MLRNILALDLGRGSLGVSISRSGMFVTPLFEIRFHLEDYNECLSLLMERIRGEKVEHIVIGYPLYPSGDHCPMTAVVERFIPMLEEKFPGIDIEKQDERYSTSEASMLLSDMGINAKRQKRRIDALASSVILERYLTKIGQM